MGLYGPSSGRAGGDEGEGVRGSPAISMMRGASSMGGESRPGEALAGGVLNRRGILGSGGCFPRREAGRAGGGSPWPIPESGLVLALVPSSVLRRRLSNSVLANATIRSNPLLILSCHWSPLSSSSRAARHRHQWIRFWRFELPALFLGHRRIKASNFTRAEWLYLLSISKQIPVF